VAKLYQYDRSSFLMGASIAAWQTHTTRTPIVPAALIDEDRGTGAIAQP
jgi:hypothetical protein